MWRFILKVEGMVVYVRFFNFGDLLMKNFFIFDIKFDFKGR